MGLVKHVHGSHHNNSLFSPSELVPIFNITYFKGFSTQSLILGLQFTLGTILLVELMPLKYFDLQAQLVSRAFIYPKLHLGSGVSCF